MAEDSHNKLGRKRELTKKELQWVSDVMAGASQGQKPSIRWFAHYLKVSRPKLIKALGGWKGIQRKRPQSSRPLVSPINTVENKPLSIEPFTQEVKINGNVT